MCIRDSSVPTLVLERGRSFIRLKMPGWTADGGTFSPAGRAAGRGGDRRSEGTGDRGAGSSWRQRCHRLFRSGLRHLGGARARHRRIGDDQVGPGRPAHLPRRGLGVRPLGTVGLRGLCGPPVSPGDARVLPAGAALERCTGAAHWDSLTRLPCFVATCWRCCPYCSSCCPRACPPSTSDRTRSSTRRSGSRSSRPVSYTHLRAHETPEHLV